MFPWAWAQEKAKVCIKVNFKVKDIVGIIVTNTRCNSYSNRFQQSRKCMSSDVRMHLQKKQNSRLEENKRQKLLKICFHPKWLNWFDSADKCWVKSHFIHTLLNHNLAPGGGVSSGRRLTAGRVNKLEEKGQELTDEWKRGLAWQHAQNMEGDRNDPPSGGKLCCIKHQHSGR